MKQELKAKVQREIIEKKAIFKEFKVLNVSPSKVVLEERRKGFTLNSMEYINKIAESNDCLWCCLVTGDGFLRVWLY